MSYSYMKESAQMLREFAEARTSRENKKITAFLTEMQEKSDEIYTIREEADFRRRVHHDYKSKVLTEMLSTALKGIFITAMESCTDMTKSDYMVCEALVDRYVEENGARNILDSKMDKRTYLLDTLKTYVEDATEEAEEEADEQDKEVERIPDEPKEKMLDKMENEEDVDTAVELLSKRISNAEEEFIRKNAEDKKKIEEIITNIDKRIQSVRQDNTTDEETKEAIEQEQSILCKRRISEVYDRRPHDIFETMLQEVSTSAVSNSEMKSVYTLEDGSLDMGKIVNSTKCLYGFLEFVNSIKLEKVDENYVKQVLSDL